MKNDSNNRVPANKHYLSRRVGWIVFIFMLGIGGYLALPSNYYLRRALIHLLPKINQYPIFENRVVKAGSPRPWELSKLTIRKVFQSVIFPGLRNWVRLPM